MKGKLTNLMSLALCALGLGLAPAVEAYTPVVVTGFNHDVVANVTGNSTGTTTGGVDGGAYVYMDATYNPTGTHLNTGGLYTSAVTTGLQFQLASYTANNDLRIPAVGPGVGTGTLTFATPQNASDVYVLGNSGDAASTVTMTVNFTDGTTQAFTGQTVADWFVGTNPAISGMGRTQRGIDMIENSTVNPRMFQTRLTIAAGNIAKLIQSVTFNRTNATGVLNVYAISIDAPCSGQPAGGTPTANVTNACSGTAINLSLPGSSAGTGISYQWQSSPTGTNTFTNLGASQAAPGYNGATQTAATDYRVIITCSGSGLSTTSGIVTVNQNTFLNCYCTPVSGNCTNEWIRGVTFGSLVNTATTCTTGGYVDYTTNTALTTTIIPGSAYPLTVDVRFNAISSQVGVWIDFNHNGLFDTSEFTLVGTGPSTNFNNLNTSFTANISVPAAALTGMTRMRVRSLNGTLTSSQACLNSGVGEVEDYFVTVAAPVACTGTPVAGTAVASAPSVCPNVSFNLSVTGLTPGVSGLTYQWESSPAAAGTFTPIAGATSATYTVTNQTASTDYRLVVSCPASSTSALSTVVTVTRSAVLDCYCLPTYAGGGTGDIIQSVTLGTLVNNTAAAGNVTPFYHSYAAQQPTPLAVPTLTTGTTANVVVTVGSEDVQFTAVWIDFDQSGVFDANEYFSLGTSAGSNGTATIPVAVPTTALAGQTKMRVRGGDDLLIAATEACGATQSDYGEAEDYLVNIMVVTGTRNGQHDVALSAFPNPATSMLTVQVATAASATVQLTDLTGRVLQTATIASQKATFNMSSLAAGIYLVRYSDANSTKTIKVAKQ